MVTMIARGLKLLSRLFGAPFVVMTAAWEVPTEPIPPSLTTLL